MKSFFTQAAPDRSAPGTAVSPRRRTRFPRMSVSTPSKTEGQHERVWGFLIEHRDSSTQEGRPVVSAVRQEQIAARVGLPLHKVIEAINELRREGRLDIERQAVGNPNRYLLRDHADKSDAIAI